MTDGGQDAVVEGVADYYDRNTGRFLFMGSGGHAIHRELWASGVRTAREAATHVDRLISDELAELATRSVPVVVDFGCGVGGTLFHLAERFPTARLHGITVSRRQVEMARDLCARKEMETRCSFTHGDFHVADLDLRADAIVAIESFAHSHSAEGFVRNVAEHLEVGGLLVMADDFLAVPEGALGERERLLVAQLRSGWRVPAICTPEHLESIASVHGLSPEKNVDLTPLVRPGRRVRDRLVSLAAPLLATMDVTRFPLYGNMIGGNALQIGLREGFLGYRLLVFRRA